MSLEYTFECPLVNGLHARPASHFSDAVEKFVSQVTLLNERNGLHANAKSVFSLVGADVMLNDPCRVMVSGDDEDAALMALVEFVTNALPQCDEPLPEITSTGHPGTLPRALSKEDVACLFGTPVSQGIGSGIVVRAGSLELPDELRCAAAGDPALEQRKLESAMAAVRADLDGQLMRARADVEAEIIHAHIAMVKDATLADDLQERITGQGLTAGQAVVEAIRSFSEKLIASDSVYLRERAVDLEDIGRQLLEHICGDLVRQVDIVLTEPSVVVAKNLAPRQFLSLDRTHLQGLLLEEAGTTSHTVILARSFGIPAVTGTAGSACIEAGRKVILDGDRGLVLLDLSPSVVRFYDRERERNRRRHERLSAHIHAAAATMDGHRIEIGSNIASAVEAKAALANGADGVGLFRTEMLFMGRSTPPTEDEQFDIYKSAVLDMAGRSVVIRTLDIGGDKPVPCLSLPSEANPFLGYRGIRLYADHEELFTAQLRAILRASACGPVKMMAPMVSSVEEAAWLRTRVSEVQADLREQGIPFDESMPVGVMIEVPSAALAIDQLSDVVDFFSIGTNDLCQYFLAVDRGNQQISSLYSEHHPPFVRLLKTIVDEAHKRNKWVGLCGEMAGSIDNLPLLVGLGLDEISLASPGIPAVKAGIGNTAYSQCRECVDSAITCRGVEEVNGLLRGFSDGGSASPLVSADLVTLDSDCLSKEEVINELADLLYIAGRTDNPTLVEDAIWAREAVYSTGLGYGFAIPHCKTDSVSANSIAVLKLRTPLEWGSIDDLPVQFVILLAIRESGRDDAHMRIFSKLARKLMHEEFREQLLGAQTSDAVVSFLADGLGI